MTAPTDGFMKAPDPTPTTPQDDAPNDAVDMAQTGVLPDRLRAEMQSAQAAHMDDGPGRVVHTRLPLRLIERAKQSSGIRSDEDLLHAALVHLVMDAGQQPGH